MEDMEENENEMMIQLSSDFKKMTMKAYEIGITSEEIQRVIIELLAKNSLMLWRDLHQNDAEKESVHEERWCQDNFIWQTLNLLRGEMFSNFFQANEGM